MSKGRFLIDELEDERVILAISESICEPRVGGQAGGWEPGQNR